MNNILVEGLFGHGAKLQWKITHEINRINRDTIGRSNIPFDWSVGLPGRPTYNIKNQYQAGSCWGQMFSRMIQIINASEELSAKSAYSPIYAQGGGVFLSTGESEALDTGLTTEANVPSTLNGTATEAFMEDTSWRTNPLIKDALSRAGLQTVNVNIDIDSIAEAIRDYKCIGWMIRGQNNGTWLGQYPQPPVGGGNLWGHYMCSDSNIQPVVGNNPKFIRMYQSWGEEVGLNGFQDFGENYIDSGSIVDVFTFIPYQFQSNLFLGMYSEGVKQLQRRLGVSMTGWFGPLTYATVKAYQSAHGIPNTGYVGPLTRASLNG